MVTQVVVVVGYQDVKNHAAKLLFDLLWWQLQLAHDEKRLFVAVCAGGVEIEMRHRAERRHVQFATRSGAVEAARHKMAASIFLQ